MSDISENSDAISYVRFRPHGYNSMLTFFINNAFIEANLTYRPTLTVNINGFKLFPKTPTHYDELIGFNEADFWNIMHVNREIVRKTIRFFDLMVDDEIACVDPRKIRKVIPMCIWYLANKDCTLEEMTEFFGLNSVQKGEELLMDGFKYLSKLQDLSIICPHPNDLLHKAKENIKNFYHLKNVVAYVGNLKLTTQLGDTWLVQVIMDVECNIYAYDISSDLNIVSAFKESRSLRDAIKSLPKNCYLYGNLEYSVFEKFPVNILAPPKGTADDNENGFDEYTLSLIPMRYTLKQLQMRFPKVNNLHKFMPEAIITALILQNICTMSNDLPPRRLGAGEL